MSWRHFVILARSGSLAMLAAIRRASSLVSSLAADRRAAHLTNARSHLDVLHTQRLSNL